MLFAAVSAQTDTVMLTFMGYYADNNQSVQLDSVKVQNMTRGWTEILYDPDYELILINGTGIQDRPSTNGFVLSQNMPNPFSGITFVNLSLAEPGDVTLVITDITGRIVETVHTPSLQPGNHKMRVTLSSTGIYFLTAWQRGQRASIKMLSNGSSGQCSGIEYIGAAEHQNPFFAQQKKSSFKGESLHPFDSHDMMRYVGYSTNTNNQTMYSATINKQLGRTSQTIKLLFSEQNILGGTSCPNIPTVTDYDGNLYNTVQIGNQCWMRENLRTTHYADGTAISNGSPIDDEDTLSNTKPYYYVNPVLDTTRYSAQYGYYYNWPATVKDGVSSAAVPSGVQGICPQDWHVPSDEEWLGLINYVNNQSPLNCGGSSNNIAKALAADTIFWIKCDDDCAPGDTLSPNNDSGFGAVPSGLYGDDSFNGAGFGAYFWTTSGASAGYAYGRSMFYYRPDVLRIGYKRSNGFSVRCVRNITEPLVHTLGIMEVSGNSAMIHSEVMNDGGAPVTARGVCCSTTDNPTLEDVHTSDGTGTGEFNSQITGLQPNTIYYVRAYATNSSGTAYGEVFQFRTKNPCSGSPTVTDFDGNVYETVKIGQQCWMKENLRTTHYADGTQIPLGTSSSTDLPYHYIYSSTDIPSAGYLYNWAAVMHGSNSSNSIPSGVQGVCPSGWHLPSDPEWTQLTSYVRQLYGYRCGADSIAYALVAVEVWNSSEVECSPGNFHDVYSCTGFDAVPAGNFNGEESFAGAGSNTYFWSSTSSTAGGNTKAYTRGLSYDSPEVSRIQSNKDNGFSVRCIRNN